MTVEIRPAVEADFAQLCVLFDELDELHRQARPDMFRKPAGDARSRDDVRWLIGGDDGTILVAHDRDRLAGLAVVLRRSPPAHPLLVSRKFVEIDNIVVHSAYRRRGIGRRLVAACIAWAKERGADDVEIAVHDFNVAATKFYSALGFEMSIHRLRRRLV